MNTRKAYNATSTNVYIAFLKVIYAVNQQN